MNAQLLIDAVVQQTMVFIASLATAGGVRAPLAHVAEQVFLDLTNELQNRGVKKNVIADNLGAHKVAGVRRAIQRADATLWYLPPYSPDLNPIELAFSKLKAHLRKAAEHTVPGLLRTIGRVVATFTPQECSNFLRHAGYVPT